MSPPPPSPTRVWIIMGVAGCGKSTVGQALATTLHAPFLEGDELHPPANVAAMRRDDPLTDADRAPWLDAIRTHIADALAADTTLVVACSALKRRYRDRLARPGELIAFIDLQLSRAEAERRVAARAETSDHFMPATLVASQFADYEPTQPDERARRIDATLSVDAIVRLALAGATHPRA